MGLFSSKEPIDRDRVAAALRAQVRENDERRRDDSSRAFRRAQEANDAAWAKLTPAESEAAYETNRRCGLF